MWMGELITQRGIGNGMSILIFASVVSSLPFQYYAILKEKKFIVFVILVRALDRHPGGHRRSSSRASGAYPCSSPSVWWAGACTAARAPTSR